MSNILKEQHSNAVSSTTTFIDLLNKEEDFELVWTSLDHMIFSSFGMIDKLMWGREPQITQSEVKRRFLICEKWFRIMRGELGFGLIKTLDLLPKALACELLQVDFDPEETVGRGWFPNASGIDSGIVDNS
jgi:hypothetical protein